MSGFSGFALKKAKPVSAFGDDSSSDEEAPAQQDVKRQRTSEAGASAGTGAALPPPPSDPAVRNAVEKLASYVAANGRGIEDMTRERNPGDTVFK